MAEVVAVNGEARKETAVLERALVDCQTNCRDAAQLNREDHREVFKRLNSIELMQERLVTKDSLVAGLAVFVATVVAQFVVKLVIK